MIRFPPVLLLTLAALALPLGNGCVSSAPSPLTFTVRQIAIDDRVTLMDVAQAVLVDEGFEIDQVDAAGLVVTTQPQPVSIRDGQTQRFRLSSRGRRRRIVMVRFAHEATGTKIYCRVAVEEQTTQTHRFMFDDDRGSDVPRETAIDRDAATTAAQNTVWQLVDRDETTERRIVAAILFRAGEPVSP